MTDNPTTVESAWKETVREIFDATFFAEDARDNPFAYHVRDIIDKRHHAYFNEAKTFEEWNRENQPDEG
jgi:hypothetical protein